MHFDLNKSIEILERTPSLLHLWLHGLSYEWTHEKPEGEDWSVFDVIGHLIHGEKTDWIPRMQIILSDSADKQFVPFDRFAQFENSKGKSLIQLLDEFAVWRRQNIDILRRAGLHARDLNKKGTHPEFGPVTLRQLLATWTTHDLAHISQIARILAKQYKEETGPWVQYIKLLRD